MVFRQEHHALNDVYPEEHAVLCIWCIARVIFRPPANAADPAAGCKLQAARLEAAALFNEGTAATIRAYHMKDALDDPPE